MGSAAARLVPQLNQGAAHIQDLEAAANRAGVVIGPELSAKLQGTSSLFSAFGDKMNEVREALSGSTLASFQQFKPAIDGLIQLFADVTSNVASVIEWFNDLDGAGQRSGTTFGLLGSAAQSFSGHHQRHDLC